MKKVKKKLIENIQTQDSIRLLNSVTATNNTGESLKNYWFESKEYGYGWTPASREGWIVLLVFVLFVIVQALDLTSKLGSNIEAPGIIAVYIFNLSCALAALLVITRLTGPDPKWSWSNKK